MVRLLCRPYLFSGYLASNNTDVTKYFLTKILTTYIFLPLMIDYVLGDFVRDQ